MIQGKTYKVVVKSQSFGDLEQPEKHECYREAMKHAMYLNDYFIVKNKKNKAVVTAV